MVGPGVTGEGRSVAYHWVVGGGAKRMTLNAHGPVFELGEEHLLRGIGVAVALHWYDLPRPTRVRILKQAALVADRDDATEEQLSGWLERCRERAEAICRSANGGRSSGRDGLP